jgi:ABC-type bacteriocin/lantibiotic exporter with double-glycine peptidase domain
MNKFKLLKFFILQFTIFDWIKIFINYFLVFFFIFFEVVFISVFFLLLNQSFLKSNQNFLLTFVIDKLGFLNLNFNDIVFQIKLLIATLFFKNIVQIFHTYFFYKFIFNLTANQSTNFFKNYINFEYFYFIKKNISTYSKIILKDVENSFVGILGLFLSIIGDFLYILIIIIFSSSLVSFKIIESQILLFFFIFLTFYFIYKKSLRLGESRNYFEKKVFNFVNECFNLFKEIKISNKSEELVNRFNFFINEFQKSKIISVTLSSFPKLLFEIGLLIFFYLSFLQSDLSINLFIAKFAVLVLTLVRILAPLARIFSYGSTILYNFDSLKVLVEDSKKTSISSSFSNKKYNTLNKNSTVNSIVLNNIYYSNNSKNYVFKNANFTFLKGKIYGIYGESGSGKTTLLLILAGLLSPLKGKIFINNLITNSKDIYKKYLVNYMSPNPHIFDDNIFFNISLKFSLSLKEKKKIISLLNYFNLKKFKKFPSDLENDNYPIRNISTGEKQRVAFIRSAFNNPNILLLDEPTASLDFKNEKKLFKFLNLIKQDKIIILSSHKKSHRKYCDSIINL